jgi:hypothetical protein
MVVVLMQLFAAALVVRRRYFIVAPRPLFAAAHVVRRRCLIVVPMPMPEAPRMYLIVVHRPLPAAPLVRRPPTKKTLQTGQKGTNKRHVTVKPVLLRLIYRKTGIIEIYLP